MKSRAWLYLAIVLALTLPATARADASSYEQAFVARVYQFANLNRLDIRRLNRDLHANCYILVTLATTVRSDGSVEGVSIVKSSTVPVVDRYFAYIIEQAAPYQSLADHYDPPPEKITITHEFRLDAQLWGHGIRSERPCEELGSSESLPE